MKIRTALTFLLMTFSCVPLLAVGYITISGLSVYADGNNLGFLKITYGRVLAAAIGLSFFMSILAARVFLKEIHGLTAEINRANCGDYKARFDYYKKNEIGELAGAFNNLMDSVGNEHAKMAKIVDELAEKHSQYQLTLSVSKDLVFKVNLATDEFLTASESWKEFFGREAPKNYSEAYKMGTALIHPEDFAEFRVTLAPDKIRSSFVADQYSLTRDVRVLNKEGNYIWIQNIILVTGEPDNRKIIVKIADINEIKLKEFNIIRESQKDGLTGLLRKNITEKLIADYLEGDGKNGEHGMLIIDIDDFKLINDTAGHLYGDAVLTELSKRIQNLFRNTDIIGRIGGDEFLVLLKNIKYNNLIMEKANALVEVFEGISATMQAKTKISGSIGVVRYPEDGKTYRELFLKADKALYKVKGSGKNAFSLYDHNHEWPQAMTRITNRGYVKKRKDEDLFLIETAKHSEDSIVQNILKILYESKDIHKSIMLIMEIIGRFYDVSRVYIYECFLGTKECKYTHEWCNEGIKSDIDNFKTLSKETMERYKVNFNEDGIFYCQDASQLNADIYKGQENDKVHSFLECAIYRKDEFSGFIGFEERTDKRFWVKEEIDTLVLVARLLGIALVQERHEIPLTKPIFYNS